ncbi:YqzE family protein [Calidifontibacillus oryziterrae]|uniref:YqzE family protein n=1 Tax=Calidifontibacillus oryziterrae TaxID=1191699 RepID=UPI0003638A1C|nr:YqzE family protein [Calidifontibacillus oryziterrae]
MSSNDYVKFVTEQFVKYIDTAKEERQNIKMQRKLEQEPMLTRMFGLLPLSVMLLLKRRKKSS